ncbi:DUF6049 family protein [Tessaracoccus sp.]
MDKARWTLRAIVAAALVIPFLALTPWVAQAETAGQVDVVINTNSTPVIDLANPEQVVELSGTIINTSASRVQYAAVNFWKSTTPIVDEAELERALDGPASIPVGERQQLPSEESGHVQIITREEWFEPGQRANFTVSATVGELEFQTNNAAYFVGVHVRGIVEGKKGNLTIGRGRILVTATSSPLPAVQAVELSAGPQRSLDGDFIDDALAASLSTDLGDLLSLSEDVNATVLLDPMLLMDVRALGKDHVVAGKAEPANEAAAEWASRMDDLIAEGRVLRLPWADIDLPRADAIGNLANAVEWADDSLTDPVLRRLPLAGDLGGFATPDLIKTLGQLGFTTALASNTTGGSIGPVRVVQVSDARPTNMEPDGSNTVAQQFAHQMAENLFARTPPTYVARTSADARDARTLSHQRDLMGIGPDESAATFTSDQAPPAWEKLSAHIENLVADASLRADLTGTDDLPQLQRLAAMSMSSHFATEPAALEWLVASQLPELDPSRITVSAARSFVMGSRSNEFPITIANDLELPVTLRLVFESESPQRIMVPATDFHTLQPGEHLTLTLSPQASSNSVVTVRGYMETVDGTQFGPPVTIDITSTELGRVGWIIIVISGAVVLGGTVWRIRAVQAERSKEDA